MADGNFVHLHTHSHYSLLDCTATVEHLVDAATAAGMKALAVTDHGNMFGCIEFYEAASSAHIKPIIGYEAYVAPDSRLSKASRSIADASYHLTLLARNETGYRNLTRLASIAYTEGFYYRPRIDKEVLAKHSAGLICLSGCLAGRLSQTLASGDMQGALAHAAEYRDIFEQGAFYVEVQDHGLAEQRRVLPGLISVAQALDLPLVATNDIHYVSAADADAHDVLLCINTGKLVTDENRLRFQSRDFYFKSESEMRALFPDHPSAIDNTARIADAVDLKIRFNELHFPKFVPPGGLSPEEYLRKLCEEGLLRRFSAPGDDARARLAKELDIICRMGFASYFLIVSDFVRYAKSEDIPVGPGRGSAAGSLVSYCLEITDLNPLAYDLLFERFLDEKRKEMPDIDIDFCMEKRDRVIRYVRDKYGDDRVAQIITFGTMAAKGAVRDVGRALGVPLSEVNRLAGLIPTTLGTTLESAFKAEPRLQEACDADSQTARLFEVARKIEGLGRHPSVHAAGVVIADKPLEEYVPLYVADGERITQFTMDILPKVGLLKMDFLGLRTLTILRRAVDLIRDGRGVDIDLAALPLDDSRTYDLLAGGHTMGVFQCESSGFRELLKRLKPDKFSDVIALVALYRPGPLGGGMVDDFVERKHGRARVEYKHSSLEPILRETYGVMAYQEQVMQILNAMGGLSMSDSYALIKAISKKKSDVIEARRDDFVKGAVANGVKEAVATEIFDLITFFGGYGFNKSHSTCYALLAYQTAYLKANWPVEFFAATMTFEMGDTGKLDHFIKDARHFGLDILPPDVNRSVADFAPEKTASGAWAVRYGLAALKGVGPKPVEALVAARARSGPFKSLFHLSENVELRQVPKSVLEIFVKAGALDSFGARRAQLMAALPEAVDAAASAQADRKAGQATFFGAASGLSEESAPARLPDVREWSSTDLAVFEKEVFGFHFANNPLGDHLDVIERYSTATAESLVSLPADVDVMVGGIISALKNMSTRKGEPMARFELGTASGAAIGAVIFPADFAAYRELIANDRVVLVRGRVDRTNDPPGVKASEVIPIDQADSKLARKVFVDLPGESVGEDLIEALADLCRRHPGRVPVLFRVQLGPAKALLAAGRAFSVFPSQALIDDCAQVLGSGRVSFAGGPLVSNGNGSGNGYPRRRRPNGF